jgi:hypothetical protein
MNEYEPLDRVLISVNIIPSYNFTQITLFQNQPLPSHIAGVLNWGF